jgi:hypothetical protein
MKATRAATSLLRTAVTTDGNLEVVVADAAGKENKLCLTADTASSVFRVLEEFASRASPCAGTVLTKRPKAFAVGTGRFERIVLLRFEDDAPYALRPEDASNLAEALKEQTEIAISRPEQVLQ